MFGASVVLVNETLVPISDPLVDDQHTKVPVGVAGLDGSTIE
jgi:hypothetical protein